MIPEVVGAGDPNCAMTVSRMSTDPYKTAAISGFAGQVRCQRYRGQNFLYWLRKRLLRERSAR